MRNYRQSTIDDHKSKFELFDTVYIMHENKIIHALVYGINIKITPSSPILKPDTFFVDTHVEYLLDETFTLDPNQIHSCLVVDESNCFASKDELIQNLKGD